MKKIAVLLSGSGYLDGAEIRESVLTLLALDRHNIEVSIFAPNKKQLHVVNHLDGSETAETRNVLVESARIARGKVSDLNEANADNFDALILPGGFGVAKNFSDMAFKGSEATIDHDVAELVRSFHNAKKPIGGICISPLLLAIVLGDEKPCLTIGSDEGTAGEIEKTGSLHERCGANDIVVDKNLKIVTTPAYMYDDAKLHHVNDGIEKCVNRVIELIN